MKPKDEALFDYVIVGAGAAGCVLANRLSEDPAIRVCLVEAGPADRNPLIPIPLASMLLAQNGMLSWGYRTVPEAATASRVIPFARGKVLGGTTSINGMVYMRGHRSDYDDWARAGNEGWAYRDVLPYFIRSENNRVWRDSAYHGTSGPVDISDPTHVSGLARAFVDGMVEMGVPRCEDFNGADQEGVGYRQLFQKRGRRVSAASAYLAPARKRPNLRVWTDMLADRLVLEDCKCVGADLIGADGTTRVRARREVILSAGTLDSPAILLRSGIGNGERLRQIGIETLHHLPEVGRNYQDHVNVMVRNDNPARTSYGMSLRTAPGLAWSPFQWAMSGRGLVASNLAYASAFIRTDPALDRPDLQLIFWPAHRVPGRLVALGHSFCVMAHVLRPQSRGEVGISSADPRAQPSIRTGLLTADADVELLTKGIRMARRLFRSEALRPHSGRELEPGPHVESDAALAAYIRENAIQGLHCAGTCRMGADADAVVRPDLRVNGMEGLRIADASIMPNIIGGNTAAPTMMIGEKASNLIREAA
jgi:choline dehydrogenase